MNLLVAAANIVFVLTLVFGIYFLFAGLFSAQGARGYFQKNATVGQILVGILVIMLIVSLVFGFYNDLTGDQETMTSIWDMLRGVASACLPGADCPGG